VSKLLGAAGVVAVLVLAMTFAALNGDQRVTLDLGWVTLYRVPVTLVAFGGLFFGMLVMLDLFTGDEEEPERRVDAD
jgi:hypothetical protein